MNNEQHIRMKNLYSIYVYTVYNSMYVVLHIYICSYILRYLRLYVHVYTYKHVHTQIRKNIRKHMCMRNMYSTYVLYKFFIGACNILRIYVCPYILPYSRLYVYSLHTYLIYVFHIRVYICISTTCQIRVHRMYLRSLLAFIRVYTYLGVHVHV